MYRIYLRWPDQTVTDKTVTESEAVANFAYQELVSRADLVGKSCAVAYSMNGKQVAYYRFGAKEHDQTD